MLIICTVYLLQYINMEIKKVLCYVVLMWSVSNVDFVRHAASLVSYSVIPFKAKLQQDAAYCSKMAKKKKSHSHFIILSKALASFSLFRSLERYNHRLY